MSRFYLPFALEELSNMTAAIAWRRDTLLPNRILTDNNAVLNDIEHGSEALGKCILERVRVRVQPSNGNDLIVHEASGVVVRTDVFFKTVPFLLDYVKHGALHLLEPVEVWNAAEDEDESTALRH